ncbi:MAG TPA: ATP-binding protein, partial [bacterium]|nr:ATP-binding protein [bacterium]
MTARQELIKVYARQLKLPTLTSCQEVIRQVIMIGNPGTGKTHLAIGLGRRLVSQGFNVRYYTAARLASELVEAEQERNLTRLVKSLQKLDLLILDELSYLSFTRHQAELMFQVVSERNERGSIIITTNLEFSEWNQVFGDE